MSDVGDTVYAAKVVRAAATELGVFVAPSLPGEEHDDGRPVQHHFLLYLALLTARVEKLQEDNLADPKDAAIFEKMLAAARAREDELDR